MRTEVKSSKLNDNDIEKNQIEILCSSKAKGFYLYIETAKITVELGVV